MTTADTCICHEEVITEVMVFRDRCSVCIDNNDANGESLLGFSPSFSDKTATTLKISALVAYPVHAISLKCLH